MKAKITSVAGAHPSTLIKNDDFITNYKLDTSDEWIKTRTGIEQRYICSEDEDILTLSTKAATNALEKANLAPDKIDMIIVSTSTAPHSGFPSLACLIQKELHLPNCPAFDISAACTGFNYALTIGQQFIENKQHKNILIISADTLSELVNWQDRSTCILFGDAAAAIVLSESNDDTGILLSKLYADGKQATILTGDKDKKINMEGKQVFKTAIQNCIPSIHECLKKQNLTPSQLKYVIPHQANQRIMDQLKLKLKLTESQLVSTIAKFGNTSSASIPYALYTLEKANKLKHNDIILLVGFGSGFTWGVNIIKWSKS